MKNSKKYEKNVDQSTRSRSFVCRRAVRLLVLLVMITTILASFAVPASAADPFNGHRKIMINGVDFYQAYSHKIYNPIPLKRIDFDSTSYCIFSFNNGVFTIDINANVTSILFFDFVDVSLLDVPFESCDQYISIFFDSSESIDIPPNFNIIEYITQNYPDYLDSNIFSISFDSVSRVYNFVIREGFYSIEFEGGIRSVFDVILSWIGNTFSQLSRIFFADGSLTFVGILCVASLAVGVILLLFSIISRFLRFGG